MSPFEWCSGGGCYGGGMVVLVLRIPEASVGGAGMIGFVLVSPGTAHSRRGQKSQAG